MDGFRLFVVVGVLLAGMGLYGVVSRPRLLTKMIAVNVMGSGVFLVLVALAARSPDEPDPVPHAMVLTGIVVTVAATGFAMALIRRLHQLTGSDRLDGGS